ncbi:MAG: hypothetical protein ACK4IS_02670 [Erythrobacter sp.]
MRREQLTLAALALAGLATGCKPPPTDSDTARAATIVSLKAPSAPQPSPDTTNAVWRVSEKQAGRLVYGIPGEPALLALECLAATDDAPAAIRIARYAPADKDAGALLALIGNGAIARLEVDAVREGQRQFWQGQAPAQSLAWEPLNGPREITATVPGAGLVRLNPSALPMEFLAQCRSYGLAEPASPQ